MFRNNSKSKTNLEWEKVKKLVKKSPTIGDALRACLGSDSIFTNHEIKAKWKLSNERLLDEIEKFEMEF